jgi:hypothetical protein
MKKKPKTEIFTTSWGSKITLTVDKRLNKLKDKDLAPEMLKKANENLSRITNLKDFYK